MLFAFPFVYLLSALLIAENGKVEFVQKQQGDLFKTALRAEQQLFIKKRANSALTLRRL